MYTIALLFCLHGTPTSCKPPVYPGLEPMPMMACALTAQPLAGRMLSEDPELQGYELRRAICEPVAKPKERPA